MTPQPVPTSISLAQIARTFLLYGLIGFGGPAAHLALMERELVTRRGWITRDQFLDMLAAINLVPGPNSTEMAIHIGLEKGGVRGMLLAGFGFILPAVVLSTIAAYLYVNYGSVPAVAGILIGVKPIMLVLILSAAYRLGVKALDNPLMRGLFVLALIAAALTAPSIMAVFRLNAIAVPELVILIITGLIYAVVTSPRPTPVVSVIVPGIILLMQNAVKIPTVGDIFVRFLAIGATLFGSGYVIASYMTRYFVEPGYLTPAQLVDVLTIGQTTPGPVLSTAAAAGYVMTAQPGSVLSGLPAAILGTIGVFLPAFLLVLALGSVTPRLRKNPFMLRFLKGVNAAVIALLVIAFVNLSLGTLVRASGGLDGLSLLITGLAFLALERFKLDPTLLIVIGAIIGVARQFFGLV